MVEVSALSKGSRNTAGRLTASRSDKAATSTGGCRSVQPWSSRRRVTASQSDVSLAPKHSELMPQHQELQSSRQPLATAHVQWRPMPSKRPPVGLFVVASVLVLAACDGSAAPDATGLDPAKCADPNFTSAHTDFCVDNASVPETPAVEAATLSNGLKVRISSAKSETVDSKGYDSGPTESVLVTITTEITNTGSTTFVFPTTKGTVRAELLYGRNHAKATNSAVRKGDSTDLPEQLVAGRSVTMTSTFTMRAGGADNVVFRFNPDNTAASDVTFTNVQTLYK